MKLLAARGARERDDDGGGARCGGGGGDGGGGGSLARDLVAKGGAKRVRIAAWLRATRGFSTPLHYLDTITPAECRALLRAGADVRARGADDASAASPLGVARDARCLLYTSPSPRDRTRSRMPSSA